MKAGSLSQVLSGVELEALEKALDNLSAKQEARRVARQIRPIVPIEEWINSDYYAGPDQSRIYPYWKERIIEICNSPVPVNEVILSGSIGCGKSTCALYLVVRRLYELSCFENIPARFNLMSSSILSFLYFSLSKTQAELTGFGQIKNLIDSIPYFQEHFARCQSINSLIIWPQENLLITYGSEPSHAIGMNMMGSILDEANFFMSDAQDPNKSGNAATAKMSRMYSSIINRAKSRFIMNGIDYSLSILVSSSTTANSFTEKRISEAQGKDNVRVYQPAIWDVKPKGTYSDEHFFVFCGDEGVDPFIVTTVADVDIFKEAKGLPVIKGQTIEEAINSIPYSYRTLFIKVPENFRPSFEINIIQSLQDIAGVSVSPTGKLFNSKTAYNKCIVDGLRHPFTKDQITVSTGDSTQVQDFLIPEYRFPDPHKKHYIHIDQSVTTDFTGMAMSHIDRYITDEQGIKKPVIRIDFMLDITPPAPPRQIAIYKVRDFNFYLRDVMGVNIEKVTYDMFASQESRQVLAEGGINSDYLSVDRTDEQYLAFVNLIMEGRVEFYDYSVLRRELFDLIWYRARRKVDHPGDTASGGTKDLCDAVVGSVWNSLQSDMVEEESVDDVELLFSANSTTDDDYDIFIENTYKSLIK